MNAVNWEHVESLVDRRIDFEHNHIWPFKGSFPIDVRYLVLDRRQEVPLHRPDHLEVVVFDSGELGYEVEKSVCLLAKNDIIIVGNHLHHRCVQSGSSGPQPRATILSFLPETVHSGVPLADDLEYLMPFNGLGSSIPNVIHSDPGLCREIRELTEKIRQAIPCETGRSRLAIRTYLKMVLLALLNRCEDDTAARAAFHRQRDISACLAPVFEHVQKHYGESIRIADMSRKCAVSTCRFMSLFKEGTGQSFIEYLNRFRVAMAKELLANSDRSICEIGLETGFCNQSYFGLVFRRIAGETPLSYRRKAAGAARPVSVRLQ